MCTKLLILELIHNFKILVTFSGESANNFTKFKKTSNKESCENSSNVEKIHSTLTSCRLTVLFTLDGVGTWWLASGLMWWPTWWTRRRAQSTGRWTGSWNSRTRHNASSCSQDSKTLGTFYIICEVFVSWLTSQTCLSCRWRRRCSWMWPWGCPPPPGSAGSSLSHSTCGGVLKLYILCSL